MKKRAKPKTREPRTSAETQHYIDTGEKPLTKREARRAAAAIIYRDDWADIVAGLIDRAVNP